ncbi:hypothetical protein BDDG_08211 [Blastomyces dermatitidis ATCC 18188]|nr:hypothetical protein BDDG_08211 [Blastomyces dermatitidis ATCC 18188]
MVLISRFVPSLTAPTVETTLAFANLNFAFSLGGSKGISWSGNSCPAIVANPPRLGLRISPRGNFGAPFAQVVPSIPKLEEEYGKRVSEIAGSSDINPQGLRSDGIFADYIGADGTPIWATATSGSPTISVHLLACMLARVWSAPEAISTWSELVAERKRALGTVNHAEPLGYGDLLASHVQMSREQLAEWDNRARVWLRRADQAKKIEQTQVKLILDNITVCVNARSTTTYASTIDAWRFCFGGNGPSAPMKYVLSSTAVSILASCQYFNRTPSRRYYGDPVQAHVTLSEAATRVTMDEFGEFDVLVLGTIISGWGAGGRNSVEAVRMVITLHKVVQAQRYPKWLDIVASAACMLVEAKGVERAVLLKLINLARRRGSSFLCDPNSHPNPLFSLVQFEVFLPLLMDDEDRIDILREYAPAFFPEARADEGIIRYRFKGFLNQQQQEEEEEEGGGEREEGEKTKLSLPLTIKCGQVPQKTHHRWVDERLQANIFRDSRITNDKYNQTDLVLLSMSANRRQRVGRNTSPGDNGNDSAPKTLTYHHFVGDPNSASLFVISNLYEAYKQASSGPLWSRKPNLLRFDDISRILERGRVDRKKLAQQLYPAKINYQLDSPKVVIGTIVEKNQRAKNYDDYFTSLKCGRGINLPPFKFENAMALSSGNFLYISAPLLCDPSDKVAASNIRRMIENVRKHGLLLLVPSPPPQVLQVMTPELDNWRSIDHPVYEGQLEDTFRGTRLHLSFTDWSPPIDLGRGHRDAEAYVVESAVSVNDNGRWIADLDVLDSLKNGYGQFDHKLFFESGCAHSPSSSGDCCHPKCNAGRRETLWTKEISCINYKLG